MSVKIVTKVGRSIGWEVVEEVWDDARIEDTFDERTQPTWGLYQLVKEQDATITKLRAQVREAYVEALGSDFGADEVEFMWNGSAAKKSLGGEA